MRLNPSASSRGAGFSASSWDWIGGGIATALLALVGCSVEPSATSPLSFTPHCGDEDGDATCVARGNGRPFCDLCRPASADQGCASSRPTVPACRVGGGLATSGSAGDESSSTTGEPSTTLDTLGTDTTSAVDETGGSDSSSSSSSGGPMLPCDSPDGTFDDGCANENSARPYCVEQLCVSCTSAGGSDFCGDADGLLPACSTRTGQCSACDDVKAFACGEELPICDATGACLPCTTHAQCGTGACHIDPTDPLAGQCFVEDEVLYVDTNAVCPGDGSEATPNCSVASALASVGEAQNRLLLVAPGVYDEPAVFDADATVAIVGNGGVPSLEGDGAGFPGLTVSDGRLYMVGTRVSNNVAAEGIRCSDARMFLQGSEVGGNADYGIYTTGPCVMRLKASSVFNNLGGGIRVFGGSLELDNASVGNNGNGARGPGIRAQYASVDILYSTVAGNDGVGPDSLQCLETVGSVRNSIVVGDNPGSAALDCFSLEFATNAIDSGSFAGNGGVFVSAAYNPLWFNDEDGGDFRLGAPPLTPFGDVALWLEGDPPRDADGTTRPMGGALGYVGADEPE